MLRQAWRQMNLNLHQPLRQTQRNYQHFVWSEALAQLEKDCESCCRVPRFPDQKVTVIGAASDVGRIACLFLKQQPLVKVLAMYEEQPGSSLMGIATDIAHIDTTTAVQVYQGKRFLRNALHNADVVVVCGDSGNLWDRDLFFLHHLYVRSFALAVSRFCSHAVVAVQMPPVDCNFALFKYTLASAGVYDRRRLLGVNSVNAMRANQLYAAMANSDPARSTVPVVCGTSRCTRVPVFSSTKAFYCVPPDKLGDLTRLVREADELVHVVKNNYEQAHMSNGFALARCVASIMRGLFEKPTLIDSALVEQNEPEKCYGMEICSTPVTVGKGGIVKYHIPRLTDHEAALLDEAKVDLEDMLNLGRCYALGDDYQLHPGKIAPPCKIIPCPPCRSSAAAADSQ